MDKHSVVYVGVDAAKAKHAVALAEGGRNGEVRSLGEIDTSPAAIERLVRKLGRKYTQVHVCYEAGPTGYGLYRQIRALGHACDVIAPSLVPTRPGDRVKTNRRDAVTLARLLRAGELTAIWVPDATHEAVRDLVRAREVAAEDLRRKRQQLLSFLLRHGRSFTGRRPWSQAHCPRDGLEGSGAAVRTLPAASRYGQGGARCGRGDCPRDGGLFVGNWPARAAGLRRFAAARDRDGAAVGNSRGPLSGRAMPHARR